MSRAGQGDGGIKPSTAGRLPTARSRQQAVLTDDAVEAQDIDLTQTLLISRPEPAAPVSPEAASGEGNLSTLMLAPQELRDTLSPVLEALKTGESSPATPVSVASAGPVDAHTLLYSGTFADVLPGTHAGTHADTHASLSDARFTFFGTEALLVSHASHGQPRLEGGSEVAAPSPDRPQTARFAGRYELLALVGVGGMGSVYRARDLELDELVALKLLRRERINAPGVLARFRQEVKLARRVTHRNIARMFDLGEFEGEKYLTMEFIEGETLAARLAREGRLSVQATLEIGLELCEGLAAAHAAGIIHRDLKPENILQQPDHRVVITDFGIAWPLFEHGALDSSSAIAGTPTYMAPEQVEDKPLGPHTDLYALGEILFEMLVGQPPWQDSDLARLLAMRLLTLPPRVIDKRNDIPPDLAALVQELLATEPAQRPPSARAVQDRLQQELDHLDVGRNPNATFQPDPRGRFLTGLPRSASGKRSIAVLPLRNLGDATDQFLAEGLTEDLLDSLSMVPELKVHSRHVTRMLSQTDGDPLAVGRSLGVNSVLEGTLRRIGDQFRLSIRLTCTQDGIQLWARRFDVPAGELLVISEKMAREVSERLQGSKAQPVRQPITDPRAIELYLKARHFYHGSWGDTSIKSLELFAQAHRLAPQDPLLMAGYALALARRFGSTAWMPDQRQMCRTLAERALTAAPHLGEAHMALAWLGLNSGNIQSAARALRLAMRSAPGLADPYDLAGQLLLELGEIDDGIAMLRTAYTLEPRLEHSIRNIARIRALQGHVDEALTLLEPMLSVQENMSAAWMSLSRVLLWFRMKEAGQQYLIRLAPLEFAMKARVVAILRLVAEDYADLRYLHELERMTVEIDESPRVRSFLHQLCTELLLSMGEVERARVHLVAADDEFLLDIFWLENCPLTKPLVNLPEYQRVLANFQTRKAIILQRLLENTR